jgi:uncharacterized protein (TIGR02145 family)
MNNELLAVISQKSSVNRHKLLVNLIVLSFTIHLLLFTFHCFSQGIGINITGAQADNSAILDLSSTSQGLLIPRMTTTQRNTIASPELSLLIFNTSTNCFEAYVNRQWYSVSCPPPCTPPPAPTSGTNTPSQTQIVWNWNSVTAAKSYQWNTSSTYPGSGKNQVTSPSYTQTGLTCNTTSTLYVWSYNSCGNSTATILTQTVSSCNYICGGDGTFIDARDGQTYGYVIIGTQTWMCQNLNAIKYINGVAINNEIDNTSWINLKTGAYCSYNNDANNAITYGRLYNWYAVNNANRICPSDWHMPTHDEWTTLISYLGGESIAGSKLKETGFTHWQSPNTGATNSSGFTALPGGYRHCDDGKFSSLYLNGYWWSDTENDVQDAWLCDMLYNHPDALQYNGYKTNGFSVRCVHN